VAQGLLIIETSPIRVGRPPGRGIGTTQRPLPDDTHNPGGIWNRNPRKRAATDPQPRPRGHGSTYA